MERFGKFLVIATSLLFAGFDPSPCRAQPPASALLDWFDTASPPVHG